MVRVAHAFRIARQPGLRLAEGPDGFEPIPAESIDHPVNIANCKMNIAKVQLIRHAKSTPRC